LFLPKEILEVLYILLGKIIMKEPSEIVKEFISQACSLFDQHSKIEEYLWDEEAKRRYRMEHKKLCERFGFKINKHNFSESGSRTPIIYDKHEVVREEKISDQKVKVFTEVPPEHKECFSTLVFYCELTQDRWIITKLREIDKSDGGKEAAPWCW
jgi:hypothetical protein